MPAWVGMYDKPKYSGKRKRASTRVVTTTTAPARSRVPRAVPGYTRRVGYYGRYNRPSNAPELKFLDNVNGWAFDATGEVPVSAQLLTVVQGTGESQRIGRKIRVKSVQGKYNLNFVPGAATAAATTVFWWLVWDKQANGAAAAVTDVFTTAATSIAPRNLVNSDRFVILKRFKVKLCAQAGVSAAYNKDVRSVEFYKKCDIPIEYSSTTGAIAEIKSNNLFFIAVSDNESDDTANLIGVTRIRYTDV